MTTPIIAVKDKIVAQELTETKTPGGIIIPDSAKSPQFVGKVLSVGPEVTTCKEEDIIVAHKNGGMAVFINNEVFKILKSDEVYGLMDRE